MSNLYDFKLINANSPNWLNLDYGYTNSLFQGNSNFNLTPQNQSVPSPTSGTNSWLNGFNETAGKYAVPLLAGMGQNLFNPNTGIKGFNAENLANLMSIGPLTDAKNSAQAQQTAFEVDDAQRAIRRASAAQAFADDIFTWPVRLRINEIAELNNRNKLNEDFASATSGKKGGTGGYSQMDMALNPGGVFITPFSRLSSIPGGAIPPKLVS